MSRYQVSDNLLSALIQQESGGNNRAVSRVGARGITQVMPKTAQDPGFGVTPLRDNSEGEYKRFGRDYLSAMLDRYEGNIPKALAAYNAGPGAVDKAGGVPKIKETQNYVKNIMHMMNPINEASASEKPWGPPAGAPDPQEWLKEHRAKQAAPIQSENVPANPYLKLNPGAPSPQEWLKAHRASKQAAPDEKSLEQFGHNTIRDMKEIGQGVIDLGTALNPVNKVVGYIKDPEQALNTDIQRIKDFPSNIGGAVKSIGNSIAHPIESAYKSPISTAMNIAGVAGLAKNAAKSVVARATSTPQEIVSINRTNALNAPKRDILMRSQAEGLAVPASEVNPSIVRNAAEGVAGKAALGQQAIINNQKIITAMARKGLGLADDAPITADTLNDLKKTHYKPYEDVSNLPNQPSLANGYSVNTHTPSNPRADLEAWKQANTDARGYSNAAKAQGGNPELVAKANQAKAEAARLQAVFERKAQAAGNPELVKQLKEARVKLAEIHTVEKAYNPATGEINPNVFGKRLQDGKPLGEEFKKIAEFNKAFPKFAKSAEGVQSPGVSKINAPVAIGVGSIIGGMPGYAAGLASMLVPGAVRKAMLSPGFQHKYAILAEQSPREANKLLKLAASGNATPNKLNAALLAASSKQEK